MALLDPKKFINAGKSTALGKTERAEAVDEALYEWVERWESIGVCSKKQKKPKKVDIQLYRCLRHHMADNKYTIEQAFINWSGRKFFKGQLLKDYNDVKRGKKYGK